MWKRAWGDTLPELWNSWGKRLRNLILLVITLLIVRGVGGWEQMNEEMRWLISGGIASVVVLLGLFLFNLIRAPVFMKWEREKEPRIEVQILTGKREHDYQHQHLMWAELDVKNTSISLPLRDVEVKIADVIDILPRQDAPGKYILYPVQKLSSMSVCWSERFSSPNQLKLTIPANSSRCALVAFSDDSNGRWTCFNTPISPKPILLGGACIHIEVSSLDSSTWKGLFFIECHPNYVNGPRARFELVEWETWKANHEITTPESIGRKEDWRTQ